MLILCVITTMLPSRVHHLEFPMLPLSWYLNTTFIHQWLQLDISVLAILKILVTLAILAILAIGLCIPHTYLPAYLQLPVRIPAFPQTHS